MKIIEYLIASNIEPHTLQAVVNELIDNGWQPHGNMVVANALCCQPMVRYENPAAPWSPDGCQAGTMSDLLRSELDHLRKINEMAFGSGNKCPHGTCEQHPSADAYRDLPV